MSTTEAGWTPAGSVDDLPEGKGAKVQIGDDTVLLVRSGERIVAIGNRCTHQGAPLDRGRVKVTGSLATVTCPAHGSIFNLDDGRVMRGPATRPVASYETRVVEGTVEVRARAEP